MVDRLTQQLEFLQTIDALKRVDRASPIIARTRRENSAEHSWHLAMYALVLAEHAPADVDISRVIQMLPLHDIVEIDAGQDLVCAAARMDDGGLPAFHHDGLERGSWRGGPQQGEGA